MSRGSCIILCFLVSLLRQHGKAQEPQSLWFHPLGEKQGLSQSFNWYVFHDSEGFVWVSSIAGLNRFDGIQTKQYLNVQQDSSSLFDENVYSDFFEDRSTNLWFSTFNAIHCYIRKHDKFQRYFIYDHKKQVLGPYKVQFLEQDSFLWVTASKTLYRMNINRPRDPAVPVAVTAQFKCRMELDDNKAVRKVFAFGMEKGLEVFSIKRDKSGGIAPLACTRQVMFAKESVREVLSENQHKIWVSSSASGLFSCNPNDVEVKPPPGLFAGGTVAFTHWKAQKLLLVVRGKGIFIFDTRNGLLKALPTRFIGQDESSLLTVKWIYCDKDDNVWLSDETTGLYFANLYKTKFNSIPKFQSPKINSKYTYWSIKEDRDANIWIGTSPGGVFLLNKKLEPVGHFVNAPLDPNSLPSNWVRAIEVDRENNVYLATSVGLALFNPANRGFKLIPGENGEKHLLINHLLLSSTGRLFATTERAGIFEVKNLGKGATLVEMIPNSSGEFQTIFEGPDQNLYCTKNAQQIDVYSFKNGPLQRLDSLPVTGLVNGFYEDESHSIQYFATSNGLARLDKTNESGAPMVFTEANGLPGKNIVALLSDAEQKIWLGTNKGLAYYDGSNDVFRSFSTSDGMQSTEFNLTAAMKRSNGELWFGGSDGITVVSKDGRFKDIEILPKTFIKRININDNEPDSLYCQLTGATNCSQIQQLHLRYSQNTISFEFAAIEYSDPENVRMRYKLEGADAAWVEIEKGHPFFARYPTLRYGKYSLWLQAANADGKWSPEKEVIHITIDPPWYLQWWFLALLGFSIIGASYRYYLHRIARVRKEAAIKQQMAETETAILRLQMNPHFIFNSMNSINAYILNKDIDTASDYLARFAKLMRRILDLAAKPYIPIADEIDFLEQYLKTEAMRFEKKFSYFFEVDPAIDPEDVVIPTMILQPFVENAIWHGLLNKNGAGSIKIFFSRQDETLNCYVEDNGIGRAAARKLKEGSVAHESKALPITARRLKLLEAEHGIKAGYDIIDMQDADGNALGTKIHLYLPLLQ